NGCVWGVRPKSPLHLQDGGRDIWDPSPDRESKLAVLRSGSLYDLRAYVGERKPSKLYEEEEEEQRSVPPPHISPKKAKELEDERKAVILGQVVRKSSTVAERWSSMDELSTIDMGKGSHRGGSTTSFALSFAKPSPDWVATPVDPKNIDTEQINFSAARQQFLMLEKTNPGSFFSPGTPVMSPRPESMTKVSRHEWPSPEMATRAARGYSNAGAPGQGWADRAAHRGDGASYKSPVKEEAWAPRRADGDRSSPTGNTPGLTRAFSREDLNSNLGKMYNEGHAGHTNNGSAPEVFNGLVELREGSEGQDKGTKSSSETPIEREIRMAMEREETLWKERGLQRLAPRCEVVEIPTKPLLSMHTSPVPGRKGKDKARASLYVQREIEQETKREEDLKKQGRLLGAYDRGTPQELDARRRVFEQEEAPPQKPSPAGKAEERRSWVTELVLEQPLSHSPRFSEDTGGSSRRKPHRRSPAPQGRQRSAGAGLRSWGGEDSQGGRVSSPSTGTTVLPRAYFSLPFWKPKVSFVEEMGTQGPAGRAADHEEQYRLRTWKPQTSVLIEEEIRSDLQREEELQQQRRRRLDSGDGQRSATRSARTETLGTDSPGSSPFEERRRRVKEEGKYAGIEPVDKINTEVVESTKVIRHQSAMAQRWEAVQYVRDQD
ncbi:Mitotic interactor and substrate of PLK1, partial [Mesitornis unicolor]